MEIIPNCNNCKRIGKYEPKNGVGLLCKRCKEKENDMYDCGTSEIIKNEMTCKTCQQYPSLINKDKICIDCEK